MSLEASGVPTTATLDVPPEHPAFPGHFPGQPLWPGVLLLAEALEAVLAEPRLAAALGPAPRLAQVKFLSPVRPGARLAVELASTGRGIAFTLRDGDRIAASGQFDTPR